MQFLIWVDFHQQRTLSHYPIQQQFWHSIACFNLIKCKRFHSMNANRVKKKFQYLLASNQNRAQTQVAWSDPLRVGQLPWAPTGSDMAKFGMGKIWEPTLFSCSHRHWGSLCSLAMGLCPHAWALLPKKDWNLCWMGDCDNADFSTTDYCQEIP